MNELDKTVDQLADVLERVSAEAARLAEDLRINWPIGQAVLSFDALENAYWKYRRLYSTAKDHAFALAGRGGMASGNPPIRLL